jgi:hypothetical protein
MAINQYVLTATVTVAAGTPATAVAGEPMTGGLASVAGTIAETAGAWADPGPRTFLKGQKIMLDPAGSLFTAIGSGNLRQITPLPGDGATGGYYGTSN